MLSIKYEFEVWDFFVPYTSKTKVRPLLLNEFFPEKAAGIFIRINTVFAILWIILSSSTFKPVKLLIKYD